MKPLLACTAVLALATISTGAISTARAEDAPSFTSREGQVEFVTPSGNVGCTYTPAGGTSWYDPGHGEAELFCDRVEPAYIRIVLAGAGPAQELADVGEQSCCGAQNVLEYGREVALGPYVCAAETRGLTCTHADGHGFFVSRAAIELY